MLLLLSRTHSEILFVYLEQLNTLVGMPHVLLIGISKNKENRAKCHLGGGVLPYIRYIGMCHP